MKGVEEPQKQDVSVSIPLSYSLALFSSSAWPTGTKPSPQIQSQDLDIFLQPLLQCRSELQRKLPALSTRRSCEPRSGILPSGQRKAVTHFCGCLPSVPYPWVRPCVQSHFYMTVHFSLTPNRNMKNFPWVFGSLFLRPSLSHKSLIK